MANRDNRNRHNRGGYKSIGSKVGSDLGGHLSKAGKKGGGSKNLSFKSLRKVLSNFLSSPANAMGDFTGQLSIKNKQPSQATINRFLKKNIDITNMNKSFRIGIDVNNAINKIKNEKVKGWLKKNLPQTLKDFNINHQMYSPTKLKPGDANYTPQGTGSGQLDPDTEKYLEWIATVNPEGKTVSDYEKLYANQLAEGISLEQAMASNPANTMSFYALIDDKENQNTTQSSTNNNEMSTLKITGHDGLTNNERTIQRIFGETLNRTAAPAGLKYWTDQLERTGNVQGIYDGIMSGSEFKNRGSEIETYKAANDGAAPSEEYLDARIAPGGGRYTRSAATGEFDGGVTFGSNNTWSGPLMNTGNNTYTDEFASIQEALGIGPFSETGSTSTTTPFTKPLTEEEKVTTGGGGTNNVTITKTGPFQEDTTTGGGGSGSWLDDYADIDAFKEALGLNQSSGGMDEFMKFMMFMSMMRPQGGGGMFGGGGYGGSQYGYGGLNPGGVVSSYNPMENIASAIEAFKTIPGIGTGNINTGTNVGAVLKNPANQT